MPDASTKPAANYGRRIVYLGVGVAVLVAAYSAAWFFFARQVEDGTQRFLAEMAGRGTPARCDNAVARGYPFRIGLFCDAVGFSDEAQGVRVETGALRSAGQVYDPARLVAELDGPAELQIPGLVPIQANWQSLRASTRLAEPLPERGSVEARELAVKSMSGTELLAATDMQGHMRRNGADVDLAASVERLVLDPSLTKGRAVPVLNGEVDLTLADGVRLLASEAGSLRGTSATLRKVALTLEGGGSATLSGPLSVDEAGLVDAQLMIAITEPQAVSAALQAAFPEQAKTFGQGFMGLAALGSQPTLPLNVTKGRASLGFIPLGQIPPLE